MSDLIASDSVSVRIAPRDTRCRYWAKVIRLGMADVIVGL